MFLRASLCLTAILLAAGPALAQAQAQAATTVALSRDDQEKFLLGAKIVSDKELSIGVTNSRKAVLDDGKLQHDVHIQTVEISKASFQTQRGTELNFRDSYKFNMAAYELDKFLEINMTPPSVERKFKGQSAALTWWVDNKLMDEIERMQKKIQPPDLDRWNKQMYVVRVFDQLIYNTDRNLGNLVIDKDWNIWMIDHTRGFRMMKKLENTKNLVQIDRKLLAKLRELNKDALKAKVGKYLTGMEIDGVVGRAQEIVKFFDNEIKAKGEGAVVYDLPPRG